MHRLVLAGLLPVLCAAVTGAQSPPVLTEAEYLSALHGAHPAVRNAAEGIARADARILQSKTLENPILGIVREDPNGSIAQTELLISWQLPDISRRAWLEAREQESEVARARFTQQLLGHRLAMREAYATWAIATDRQLRLSRQAERVEVLANREAVRSSKGEASGLEAHRLRLTATALRSRVALAAAESERARAAAGAWYPDLSSELLPVLPELANAPPLDGANARVRAAETELLAARLTRKAAGRFVRSPELSLGWQRQEAGSETLEGSIVGLAWSVPIFDRNRAARDTADANLEGARARLELIERQVHTSRTAALKSFASLSDALAQARLALAINSRMLDGAEAAFRHGEAGLTDLLETHRSVTEAELAMLDLHEAALAAHRELERLAGPTDPELPRPWDASQTPNDLNDNTESSTSESIP